MPCCELFDDQSEDYKKEVFPDGVPVMSIEASAVHGWTKYAHSSFGLNSYGLSAPGAKVCPPPLSLLYYVVISHLA
jgi:transketolase